MGWQTTSLRVLCLQYNELTNKNRAIAASGKLAIAFLPQTRGISALLN
ncbi:hypothetical protein [Nostoc sp. C117]